jgi:hypothetical protein
MKAQPKTAAKPTPQQPKAPEKKIFKAEDYATLTIPV